jgi:hypothetical protein
MSSLSPSTLLRYALIGDAVASGATGLLLALGAGALTHLLGMPEPLMREAGIVLLPYAAAVAYLGTRVTVSPRAVWAVILGNAAWVAASLVLLVGNIVAPTTLGYAVVLAQALVVLVFAEAQYFGLRRSGEARAIAA